MPFKPPPPPPGVNIDLNDKEVQKAACMIQKSFRGHQYRRTLLKEDGPPRFIKELKDVNTLEDSSARIEGCISGFPDPTVKWFKDGQPLKEGPKMEILFEENNMCALVIRNLTSADAGTYTCKAYNQFGEAFDSSKLTVYCPAKIEEGPKNQSVKCGSTITLTAKVGGDPEPDVGWAKDGEDVDEDDHLSWDIDGDTTILVIKNANKKDSGKYEVYVENDQGYDHSFARVDVR